MTKISRKSAALVLAGLFLLSACSGSFSYSKEETGQIIGAAAGGILGATIGKGRGRAAATVLGVIIGTAVGQSVGRTLDDADRAAIRKADEQAKTAPIGERIVWNNPESGNHGEVVATREGYSERGRYCREFQTVVVIGGKEEAAYGTACRQPDGSWQVVNSEE